MLDPATFVRRIARKAGTAYGRLLARQAFYLVRKSGNPDPWVREVQRSRDAGELPAPIAGFLIYKFADEAMLRMVNTDPELVELSARVKAVERAAGLDEDEYFYVGQGPPEWTAATAAWDAVFDARFAGMLMRLGEEEMAKQGSRNVDPHFEAGRTLIFGKDDDMGAEEKSDGE